MKKNILTTIALIALSLSAWAQPERVGQAGAQELLINTMPRSSGLNGIDIANSDGIESSMVNPAGVAKTTGTELMFSHALWLVGSDIRVNSFGFSQSLGGGGGVLGVQVNSFSLGEFVRTTVDQPDGTLGTFSPTYLNLGITYAKKFTDRIHVGFTTRVIHESTPEVIASGVAFDAGIQYRSGEKERLKLGIALRNVGPSMRFGGDGLAGRVPVETNNNYTSTINLPTAKFELPTSLSMGGSYDLFLGSSNTVSVTAAFISNSFYTNQGGLGLSYQYKEYFVLRGAFLYEKGIFGEIYNGRYNAHTGISTGATFQIPFKTGKYDNEGNEDFSSFSLDLSYRTSNPFGGTFVFGARIYI
ncbi:MAG: PorV/PorQ family protein [Bacteroidia bacterium]|nr:PorV/PorQ family protein [Bacteroidia bacterium]